MLFMHPKLLLIFAYVMNFAYENCVPFTVTSIYRPPNDGISKERTHREFRAFDMSLIGWNQKHIDQLKAEVTTEFYDIGAIGRESGKPTPILVHDNAETEGMHAHFQIRRGL